MQNVFPRASTTVIARACRKSRLRVVRTAVVSEKQLTRNRPSRDHPLLVYPEHLFVHLLFVETGSHVPSLPANGISFKKKKENKQQHTFAPCQMRVTDCHEMIVSHIWGFLFVLVFFFFFFLCVTYSSSTPLMKPLGFPLLLPPSFNKLSRFLTLPSLGVLLWAPCSGLFSATPTRSLLLGGASCTQSGPLLSVLSE